MTGISRRRFVGMGSAAAALVLSACGGSNQKTSDGTAQQDVATQDAAATTAIATNLTLDAAAWSYDADDDVYYQLDIAYCENPADSDYEKLAIMVPGAYFSASDNGDGTYTCKVNPAGSAGAYTAETAPIVMPVNTPGYSAQAPLSAYASQEAYTNAGMVYVHAGCRGRDAGAPAGVVDLKAAVRFLRAVAAGIPGDTERIFTFGMSGGGAQSALMGAVGDVESYEPYMSAIGAVSGASDAVYGAMCWCPITGLDVGDAAYEWMMGCTRADLSEDEQAISDGLASAYAAWVNDAGIEGSDGAALKLEESEEGIYQAGSYYGQVLATIEESLNNFLADTEFPYDASSSGGMGGMPGGGAGFAGASDGAAPDGAPEGVSGGAPDGKAPGAQGEGVESDGRTRAGGPQGSPDDTSADAGQDEGGEASYTADAGQRDDIARTEASGGVCLSGTYETAADYVAALNVETEWVSYDEATNTASVLSVADFCRAMKQASKSLGAFDQLDRGQGENTLFGQDGDPSHFDAILGQVLKDVGNAYDADYFDDMHRVDALGVDVQTRVDLYTPLHYLLKNQAGYGKSTPAKHWRIRTGINQGDTALTTELNLALALEADGRVESVDFATVWGQGHTQAERSGTAEENFLTWVAACMS